MLVYLSLDIIRSLEVHIFPQDSLSVNCSYLGNIRVYSLEDIVYICGENL